MTTTHDSLLDDAHVVPVPPRFWWLKRIGGAVVVYLLLLVGARLWWGYYADSRLQAEIDKYRATGQPVTIDDLAPVFVPDAENGAILLRAATKAYTCPAGVSREAFEAALDPNRWPANAPYVRIVVAGNVQALGLVRQARMKLGSNWGNTPFATSRGVLSMFWEAEQLARLTRAAALDQHARGQDDEAVATLRDVAAIARHLQTYEPGLMTYADHLNVSALASGGVQRILHSLSISRIRAGTGGDLVPANRDELVELRNDLLDEIPLCTAWRRACYAERIRALNTACALTASPLGFMSPSWLPPRAQLEAIALAPGWKLAVCSRAHFWSALAGAAEVPNAAFARDLLPLSLLVDMPTPLVSTAPLRFALDPQMAAPWLMWHFRGLAWRRLAATAIALRLYEIDYGQRPAHLGDLVPDYLTDIPRDPLDPYDGMLRYIPGGPCPLLYSVGCDGKDDGGAYRCNGDAVDDNSLDIPWFLEQDKPRPQSPAMPR